MIHSTNLLAFIFLLVGLVAITSASPIIPQVGGSGILLGYIYLEGNAGVEKPLEYTLKQSKTSITTTVNREPESSLERLYDYSCPRPCSNCTAHELIKLVVHIHLS
ncbi:hypothetical protein BT96DRAFT_260527 [Gymnopus androsaceus JB14]|uniref:Uncharacterized protein n=1 Tax=Gymnopus androsaceus JB14 TaxID=1447944 RepID=A0A6A4H543_9AGAR|nr:hypothetical protein BT96DRAFT_260527 [Gymnopus androsaceus JB14]